MTPGATEGQRIPVRDGRDVVFDNRDYSATLSLDYAVLPEGSLYLTGEYRRGHIVSTSRSNPGPNMVEAQVRDDAFDDVARTAYRMKGRTGIATLGYSHRVAAEQSLDFSVRYVRSTVLPVSGLTAPETIRYYVTQISLA